MLYDIKTNEVVATEFCEELSNMWHINRQVSYMKGNIKERGASITEILFTGFSFRKAYNEPKEYWYKLYVTLGKLKSLLS